MGGNKSKYIKSNEEKVEECIQSNLSLTETINSVYHINSEDIVNMRFHNVSYMIIMNLSIK